MNDMTARPDANLTSSSIYSLSAQPVAVKRVLACAGHNVASLIIEGTSGTARQDATVLEPKRKMGVVVTGSHTGGLANFLLNSPQSL